MQAEEAFYQAFRTHDIELMKQVWDRTDNVFCIHPGSSRIYSFDLIIASWAHIFAGKEEINIKVCEVGYQHDAHTSIHTVKEVLRVDNHDLGVVYATNIYHQTEQQGWKMVGHHGTPALTELETRITNSLH
mgnify:FL=1